METPAVQKTHPLILVAATAVTVASLAGIGAVFGLIPTGKQEAAPAPVSAVASPAPASVTTPPAAAPVAATTPPTAAAAATAKSETTSSAPRQVKHASRPAARPVEADNSHPRGGDSYRVANEAPIYVERAEPKRAASCRDCGIIADVREVTKEADASGVGAVAGGVLGGVLGNQVGGGRGRDAMTVIGAVGGAVAGHQIEKKQRATREFQITVRFDDGTTQVITQPTEPNWRNGDRVRISNGQIVAL